MYKAAYNSFPFVWSVSKKKTYLGPVSIFQLFLKELFAIEFWNILWTTAYYLIINLPSLRVIPRQMQKLFLSKGLPLQLAKTNFWLEFSLILWKLICNWYMYNRLSKYCWLEWKLTNSLALLFNWLTVTFTWNNVSRLTHPELNRVRQYVDFPRFPYLSPSFILFISTIFQIVLVTLSPFYPLMH